MEGQTTINRLLGFLVVVEEGDYRQASQRLRTLAGGNGRSAPDRSWRLCRQLAEDIYGKGTSVALFEPVRRSDPDSEKHRLRLTGEGEEVLSRALRIREIGRAHV